MRSIIVGFIIGEENEWKCYLVWLGVGWFNLLVVLWWSVGMIWVWFLIVVCKIMFWWLVGWFELDYDFKKIGGVWSSILLVWFGKNCCDDWIGCWMIVVKFIDYM